jgi:lactoylglutathione lyase
MTVIYNVMMNITLNYIRILTRNFKEMFNFYANVMELQVKFGSEEDNYAEFENGITDLALFDLTAMEEAISTKLNHQEKNGNIMLVFAVDSIDDRYKLLKEKGVKFINEPTTRKDWNVRTAQFFDPDGNLLEINTSLNLLEAEEFYT